MKSIEVNGPHEGAALARADTEILRTLDETEATMGEQLHAVWSRKWLIIAAAIAGAVIAGVAAFVVTPKYRATILIMPVLESESGGGLGHLGGVGSELGGLATLAGLKVGGEGRDEALAVLQSRELTDMYISRNNLLPVLLKGSKGKLTLWKGNRFFKTHVRQVTSNTTTGMVSLAITWTNSVLAAEWANGLVKMTNEYMRDKAIREAERNIAYLQGEAAKTNVVEVKQGIYDMVLREINREMLARGTREFALKVIDPAVPPEKPSSPQKVIWVAVGGILGLLASMGVVIIGADRRRGRSQYPSR